MKKIIILLLLLFQFNLVYAQEYSRDATIEGINIPTIKDLDISWDSMQFTYVVKENYNYDANSHKYIKADIKYWDSSNNNIKFYNKTISDIKINLKYNSLNRNIKGIFNDNNFVIKYRQEYNVRLDIDGYLNKNNNYETIGIIELIVS